ncbi:monovalent cation/H+ antiporter subunit D [Georhizobium profundi]|uniref:Monovalent cation/H+ antiporter subunit D n=1 Tax=Georhizobium profundi TaxID=2341112 RepID=A0A3S9B3P9_9HYPH|nr:monovalent cation/H+ antiporter subunit D [Georhizobium profundi]AZN71578.1 monovalent cation/H+ antiporter subunit D [Georhizobium profundi]
MTGQFPQLIVAPIILPLIVGALLLFFDDRERRLKTSLAILSVLAQLAIGLTLLFRVHWSDDATALVYLLGNWPAPIAINLIADRLSSIMLVLGSLLAIPALVFATARWDKAGPHFHSMFQFMLVGINGAFLTGDLFNLFVFFEVMLAASYGLVLHGSGPARVKAGLHYIAINLAASLVFLIGIAMVFGATGSLNMAEISMRAAEIEGFATPGLHVGLSMLGLAFLVKAAMWPLGNWLVPAYSASAGPVAAIMAILSKVGIYALIRLSLLVPAEGEVFGSLVIFIGGAATLVFASIGLLATQSIRTATAYLVMVSSGTILATLGLSEPASTTGALYYLVTSTLATGALFLLAELLERDQDPLSAMLSVTMEAFGENSQFVDPEEEVGRPMPQAAAVLGAGFGILAMVLIGLPPLAGFLAKFAILHSVIGPGAEAMSEAVTMRLGLAALLIFSGLTALIALSRAGIRTFWAPVEPFMPRVSIVEVAPVLFLLVVIVLLSVYAGPAVDLMAATANDLHIPNGYLDAVLGAERVPPYAGGEE